MDLTECIYRGSPESARALAAEFERQGVLCFVADRFEFSAHRGASVAADAELCVSPEDRDRARLILSHWSATAEARISGTLQRVAWVVALSAIPAIVWVFSAWAMPESTPPPTLAGLALVSFVSLMVIGQLEDRRHRAERLDPPSGLHRG